MSSPEFCAADRDVLDRTSSPEYVDLILADMNGLLRGKRIAASALGKVWKQGVCLPMSLIATDITGNTVEETGLGYDIGDEDRVCMPLAGTLRPVPWAERPALQALLSMQDINGQAFAANPREVLKRIVAAFAARGLKPVIAVELEFYLLDRKLSADGHPQVSLNPTTGERNHATQVYYLQDVDDFRGFINQVSAVCAEQGIPADTAVAEYAPGQFEINLKHRDDPLAACDDALMLKRAIKAVAERCGYQASFMAKPFAEQAGSGMHVHVSLLDQQGNNVFACTPDAPADALRHAIAGLQRHADDCMLMFAPNANSYRRFVLNAFVPLNECWGFNNRTVAMRVPYSDPANVRIEHRIAGADANAYLVVASVLAGILDGLASPADPGPPIVGNAYQQTESRQLFWRDTIAQFAASEWIRQRFGDDFRHIYAAQKRKEMLTFSRQVTSLEVDWYLRHV
ncbi:glutamine synthetase family protein [Pseudomarimonas arenosa]|uniref:Glutamine synthetase n=1 Tax=Pseudomarimonas arenosa TaxID=2774145 RepID=A0AAW3ZRS5_9GAMM|nr:glutamine synthetase family protein [Pseudomarimonas arenosa]MBD8527777.1 glutamine synthetase [Pseudomarimonas arenosa]